jgi:hypothetical protein
MEVESLDTVVELLSAALGDQMAREVVAREARALGLGNNVTGTEQFALLKRIEAIPGAPGLAARLALLRLQRSRPALSTMPPSAAVSPKATTASPTTPRRLEPPAESRHSELRHSEARHSGANIPIAEVVELFAKSLGEAPADSVVKKAMARAGLSGAIISAKDAATVLDLIESDGGVAAAVARFAKVRFLLKFG